MTHRSAVWISLTAATFLTLAPAAAQSPAVLVKDVAPGQIEGAILSLETPVVFGNEAYFAADDGFLGEELWATDGTRRGTRLVADLCPGRCSGAPQAFTPSGDLLFFVAGNTTTGDNNFWVWRTDGTDDGTYPLADLSIDVFGSAGPISYLSPFRGGAVFLVRNGGREGYDLWRTDGTREGTRPFFALPGEFGLRTPFNSVHPFLSEAGPEVVRFDWQGFPWVTDGTVVGTHPVAELPITLCQEGGWVEIDHRLVYAGGDEATGCELWTTDGTVAGTHLLRDLNPGVRSSFPFGFLSTRHGIYFTAVDRYGRTRLWKTDGTAPGTIRVRTPRPERPLNHAAILGAAGSRIYFAADDGVHGIELWKTDGNPASTELVADITPGPSKTDFVFGVTVDDGLFFFAFPNNGSTDLFFHTEGTAASTVPIHGVSTIVGLLSFRGRVLFEVEPEGGGKALAENDGATEGTRILFHGQPAASSTPAALSATARGLLFTTGPSPFATEVWRTDGRRSGTHLLTNFSGQSVRPRLFSGRDGVFIYDFVPGSPVLWSDGGPQPPRALVTDPELGAPDGFVETGAGTSFFLQRGSFGNAALELWGSDGTPTGTGSLAVIDQGPNFFQVFATPGPEPGSATFIPQVPSTSVPQALPLFTTDGTAGGTRQLVDLGIANNEVLGIIATTHLSYLVTYDYGVQVVDASRLLATDGTTGGTREVFRIDNPFDHSFISEIASAGNRLYFTGDEPVAGREVWVTDGTPEGTTRVANIAPGRAGSAPSDLFALGNRLFFGADDGRHGRELWVTDGTPAGTKQIEIFPGPRGSYPQAFAAVGDHVVFAADDGVHGLELWKSDGTTAGTRLVADVNPGRFGSCPTGFATFGSDLYFSAGKTNVGYELFRVPVSALDSP